MIISDTEWFELYRPLPNPNPGAEKRAGGLSIDGKPYMLDHHNPDDLKTIQSADPKCLWTSVESENHDWGFLISGYHYVNREGYYVTERPHDGKHIEVVDEDEM